MYGIELKSGINNCYWNIHGKCTCFDITNNCAGLFQTRDWASTLNCTCTILGVHACSEYLPVAMPNWRGELNTEKQITQNITDLDERINQAMNDFIGKVDEN